MKFTLAEIRYMKEPLDKFLKNQLPVKTSWRLGKLARQIEKEFIDLENERIRLVQKYGTPDETTGEIRVQDENIKTFLDEFSEILKEEVDIEFTPVEVSSIGDIKIDTLDLMALEKLFTE